MQLDIESIVDYLRAQGQDSSFNGRRNLWQVLFPAEVYQGTAAQNTKILNFLRTSERAPKLQLTKSVVPIGSEVTAIVGGITAMGIESTLLGMSIEALPGEEVTLGTIDRFGLIPVHIFAGSFASSAELVVRPNATGTADIALWMVPYEFTAATVPVMVDHDDRDVVERFIDFIDSDFVSTAADEALTAFFEPENWLGLGLDVFIGVGVTIVTTPGGGAIYYMQMGADWGIDFFATWLEKMIDNLPNGQFSADQKSMLKLRLVGSVRVGQVLFGGFDTFTKTDRICSSLSLLGSLPGWTIQSFSLQPHDEGPKLAGKLFSDSVNKSISMVCKLTNN